MMRRQRQDQQFRAFYELSTLVLNLLRSPPTPISFSDQSSSLAAPAALSRRSVAPVASQITPYGFASMLLGDFPGYDALWIPHFLHRLHSDALGAWVGDVSVRRRDYFRSFRVRAVHSLLCHGSNPEPAEGDSFMAALVKRTLCRRSI